MKTLLLTTCLIATLAVAFLAGRYSRIRFQPSQPVLNTKSAGPNEQWQTFVENMQSEDQMTTALSLYSLRRLERGEIQPTKEFLASRVAYFYLCYGPAENPQKAVDDQGLLRAIQDFSRTNATLQAALERRAKDFSK